MENALLELKGKLKMLYASYGSYLLGLFKFLHMWKDSIRFLWCYLLH